MRFNGADVAVGTAVRVGSGTNVKVSMTGAAVCVGLSGVGEVGSGADVTIPHADEIIRQVINRVSLVRIEPI